MRTFSEPRSDGIHKLIVRFSEPISATSFIPSELEIAGLDANGAAVDLNGVTIGTSLADGDTVGVITFTPALPDHARYLVSVEGVRDLADNPLGGDGERIMTALHGDCSGDLRVNVSDFSYVRSARTKLVNPDSAEQVRADVSCDGRVNASDLSRLRARRGHDASAIPDPVIDP